jgi:uncharacterized protein YdbL (DUF1318 family)
MLYGILAGQENTSADKVAQRNAQRNFERAAPGEYLKNADGAWTRKPAAK